MMTKTTFTCLECDHEHDVEIVRGEWADQDYAELPERCENCGASTEGAPSDGGAAEERRQMGITF